MRTVCMTLRTVVTLQPRSTSVSAIQPPTLADTCAMEGRTGGLLLESQTHGRVPSQRVGNVQQQVPEPAPTRKPTAPAVAKPRGAAQLTAMVTQGSTE